MLVHPDYSDGDGSGLWFLSCLLYTSYGHWLFELGKESYVWWPAKGVDLLSTLTGVPGYLNGTLDAHAAGIASMTRDAHHLSLIHI